VFVVQAGYLDTYAADPARLPEEMPEITHADQVNLVDAEAGSLLGMGGQGRRVEEFVIADDPDPVEALLLPDKLRCMMRINSSWIFGPPTRSR